MKKRWICIFCSLALLLTLAGCGRQETVLARDWEAVQEAGVLRVGVTQCPPFCQREADGAWTGFDADLARAVCARLGVTAEFVELDWTARGEALENGTVDCLWSGLTARSDLTEQLDYSQTYLASRPVVVLHTEQAAGLGEDLAGEQVAVESGSAGEAAAKLCLPEAVVMPVASQQAALEAVRAGQAQAAVVDYLVARAAADIQPVFTLRENTALGTEELAVALRKGSDLTARLDGALVALQANGTLDALAQQYGLVDSVIVG